MKLLLIYLAAVNLAGFLLMAADKRRAVKKARRIRERTLLLTAAAGGSAGSVLGMLSFRHKTKHLKFALGLPAMLAAQALLGLWLLSRPV